MREAFGRRTFQLFGQCNFVCDGLRDGPLELERARILQLRDSRGDLGELESPAVLRTHCSLLVFRGDLVVLCDRQTDYQVGRRIVLHLLCDGLVEESPVGNPRCLDSVEGDHLVRIDIMQQLTAN